MDHIPLIIEFVAPTSLLCERDRPSALRILWNGPPGTFVVFPDGLRVSLPTDQIVYADDSAGHARVGFGGMEFAGIENDRMVFRRVRELHPHEELSPDRSHTMFLQTTWVRTIYVDGGVVWSA